METIEIHSFEDLISQLLNQAEVEGHIIYRGVKDGKAVTRVATGIQKACMCWGVRKGSIFPDFDGFAADTNIRFGDGI